MRRFYSPLRYPGGKAKIAPFIKSIFYENNLVGIDYMEPYAGGAGVALSLLYGEYVSTITINDYDRSIYAFWHSVLNHNERFCSAIENISIDISVWHEQKKIQKDKKNASLFDLGVSTFFLNRTNISGIVKGGVIGGIEQKGKYKIHARFNKADLISRIKKIKQYKERILVTNSDAKAILKSDLSDKFVYLDPPYVNKGKGLYMNYYKEQDHQEIAECLNTLPNLKWLLSYDNHPLIETLYAKCKKQYLWNIHYATSFSKGSEKIILNNKLKWDTSLNILQKKA